MVARRRYILFPIILAAVAGCQRAPGSGGPSAPAGLTTLGTCHDSVSGTSVPCRMASDSVSGTTARSSLATFVLRDPRGALVASDSLLPTCYDSTSRRLSCRIEIAVDSAAGMPGHSPVDSAHP
jgi:hypothetical protein